MTRSKNEPVISIKRRGSKKKPLARTRFESFSDLVDYKGPSTPSFIKSILSTEIGWAKQEEEEAQIIEDHKKKVNNQQSYSTPPDLFCGGYQSVYGKGMPVYTQCP